MTWRLLRLTLASVKLIVSIISVTPNAATMPNSPSVKLPRPRREIVYMFV